MTDNVARKLALITLSQGGGSSKEILAKITEIQKIIDTFKEETEKTFEGMSNAIDTLNNIFEVGTTEFKNLNNLTMPIGFIFEICDSTYTTETMTERYGGSWEEITGFTFGAGTITETSGTYTYNVGDSGGQVKHPLSVNEMPTHSHTLQRNAPYGIACCTTSGGRTYSAGDGIALYEIYAPFTVLNTGGGKAHNNMPPYIVVRKFKRTALFVEKKEAS